MDRQQLMDYIASTTHLYGIVPYEKVAEIYTEQTGDRVSAEEVRQLAQESEEDMDRMFVWAEPEFLAHDTVMQEDEAELYLEATKEKPFYVPEAEELLRYRDDNYIEMTPQAQALGKFVSQRLLFDDEEVAELQGWI